MMTHWEKIKSQTSFGRHSTHSPFSITSRHHDQSLHKRDDKQKRKVGIEKETPISARKIGKIDVFWFYSDNMRS